MILGIPGNAFTIAVLNSFLRKPPAYRYFQALAVTDLLFLCIVCLSSWIEHKFGTHPKDTSLFMCIVYRLGGNSTGLQSIVFLVVITVQRVIAVSYPLHVRALCTVRLAYIIIAVVVFGCFTPYTYTLFVTEYDNKCQWTKSYKIYGNEIMRWINATVFLFLPVTILVFSNCFLVWTLLSSTRMPAEFVSTGGTKSIFSSTLNVVVVSTILAVLTVPLSVINLVIESRNAGHDSRHQFFKEIGLILMCTKSAVNFFFYTLTGKGFRMQTLWLVGLVLHLPYNSPRTVTPSRNVATPVTVNAGLAENTVTALDQQSETGTVKTEF